MTVYNIRHAEPYDVPWLAPYLRRSDVEEIQASHGLKPLEALQQSYDCSDICQVLTVNEWPLCMFGRAPITDKAASIWMLGTSMLWKHRKELLRRTKDQVDLLHDRFPVLFNYVDERNEASIRWLKWAGARFIARHPRMGFERRPFLEFIHVKR